MMRACWPYPVWGSAMLKMGVEPFSSTAAPVATSSPAWLAPIPMLPPPLSDLSERKYLAGVLPNTPANLVRWLRDPQTIAPGSAMPDLGVSTQVALDMAAYLYGSTAPSAASIKAR